ncbi:hypothetical protein C8Q78DRAFT_548311 [Trametes maxima]|nr:hypothetical protein C8Q78DRAFT_548311 [Trametes maxima]
MAQNSALLTTILETYLVGCVCTCAPKLSLYREGQSFTPSCPRSFSRPRCFPNAAPIKLYLTSCRLPLHHPSPSSVSERRRCWATAIEAEYPPSPC